MQQRSVEEIAREVEEATRRAVLAHDEAGSLESDYELWVEDNPEPTMPDSFASVQELAKSIEKRETWRREHGALSYNYHAAVGRREEAENALTWKVQELTGASHPISFLSTDELGTPVVVTIHYAEDLEYTPKVEIALASAQAQA